MKTYDRISDLLESAGGKPVILVEGDADVRLYGRLLTLFDPDWQVRYVLEAAGRKATVFSGCKQNATWRGLVDRDQLSAAEITQEQLEAPNVQILPRFTAENYWIDPGELWNLIPPQVKVASADAQAQLRIALDAQRAAWTAHGAMWCVMLGRQAGLSDLRFPAELIKSPVTDEEKIRAILNGWHDHLEPEDILTEYRTERDKALARPEHEQYAQVIHGKRFFSKVVVRELSRAFHLPSKSPGEWAADLLASTTSVPPDLKPVLEKLLA